MLGSRSIDTLVVGAGQAGLALSRYLADAGLDHVLLEGGRVGERWRSERWDSLALLTPNWLSALPGEPHAEPDGFLGRDEFIDYLARYAAGVRAPVQERTLVTAVEADGERFSIRTDTGRWRARNVVVATGEASPRLPAAAADIPAAIRHLHASRYRSPGALLPGGVLVVGAGPSGQQLALELARAGRSVQLAVGGHSRVLRRYRGRDIWAWLAALGHLDEAVGDVHSSAQARPSPSLVLSGAHGGEQLDLAVLQAAGVQLTGRLRGFDERRAYFADDLPASVDAAERRFQALLERIDRHVERTGDVVDEEDRVAPVSVPRTPAALDLRGAGISTVIWATGYERRTPWLQIPGVAVSGRLEQRRGVTAVPGLFTLGLKLQHRRSSHMIGGVGRDAEYLAARIAERAAAARRPARLPLPVAPRLRPARASLATA